MLDLPLVVLQVLWFLVSRLLWGMPSEPKPKVYVLVWVAECDHSRTFARLPEDLRECCEADLCARLIGH